MEDTPEPTPPQLVTARQRSVRVDLRPPPYRRDSPAAGNALDSIYLARNIAMPWEVEVTDEFVHWWGSLAAHEQESVAAYVELLERRGPPLPHPYSSSGQTSRH